MVNLKKKWTIRHILIVCMVSMIITSFFVYFFSTDSHVKVLSCKDNYYLSDSEVYDLAKVSTKTRIYLVPSILLEKRVEKMPFVDSCKVSKQNRKLTFNIHEKCIIGYYVKNNKNYALSLDGSSIEIEEQYLNTIVHFPLLSNFTAKQRKQLSVQFQKSRKVLTQDLIEKIAEIVPYKSSYDKNMLKITMQDGNIVYTNLKSIKMLSKYQSVLTKLKGQSVCLVLDSTHSAIEKVNCEDLKQKQKIEQKEDTEAKPNDTTDQQESSEEESTESQESDITQEESNDVETAFEYDENTGMYYDSNTGYYMDDNGIYYYWDEDSQSLEQVQ